MKKILEIDESKLTNNPLAQGLKIPVTRIYDDKRLKPDRDGIMLPIFHHLERQQCVKIYYTPKLKKALIKLSPGAKDLFTFILTSLESSIDYVILDKEKYMHTYKISSVNTFKKAVSELCINAFIYRTEQYPKDVFWINPNFYFCGSRVNKYPNNLSLKSERSL